MRKLWLAGVTTLALAAAGCSPTKAPETSAAQPAAATAAAPAGAAAATPTADSVMLAAIDHHVEAVKAGQPDEVMKDYADDAIMVSPPGLVTPTGVFVGKDKVREFFAWLATPEVLPGAQSMQVRSEVVGPDTVLFHWTQWPGAKNEVKGTDVFVFRNGKIVFQTTAPLP